MAKTSPVINVYRFVQKVVNMVNVLRRNSANVKLVTVDRLVMLIVHHFGGAKTVRYDAIVITQLVIHSPVNAVVDLVISAINVPKHVHKVDLA